jgi:exodeoxyribonuclease V alpha subunit
VIREIMVFLHSNGVGPSRAVRIYTTYGANAVQLISENPYRLARDIGFRTADCQRDMGAVTASITAAVLVDATVAETLPAIAPSATATATASPAALLSIFGGALPS